VAFDLESGGAGKVAHYICDYALVEILDTSAVAADDMMMMLAPLRHAIVQAGILHKHAADDSDFGQQPDRTKHSGATGALVREEIVYGEVFVLLEDSRNYGTARRRYAVSPRFELQANRFKIGHDTSSQ
jgi:hypothetical protein